MSAQAALQAQQELPVQAVMEVLKAPLAEHTLRLEQDEPWRIDLRRMALDGEAVAIVVYRRMRPAVPATDPAESLRAEDALRDLESFSYTISHDLRAPIRVVEGFARIVKEDYGAQMDRIGQDHLDRILGASARMTAMIDAILSLSKLSSRPLMRQPVSISQLAGYVVDDLRRQHPDRAARVDIAPGLVVQGDPTLLRMLLDNLLGNAWKYSGLKPQVSIEVGMREEDGRQVYFVRDEGAGFDMRFADRLFGVFQRLHSSSDFEGTGIGLATVQRIVRRHGGQIWAEGQVGQGACFHFTLNETRVPQD
jgi:light-regulated signal transduction histidine kinase (bacteriophytochrome)